MCQVSLGEVRNEKIDFATRKYTAEYSEMIGSIPGIWALISASISSEAAGLYHVQIYSKEVFTFQKQDSRRLINIKITILREAIQYTNRLYIMLHRHSFGIKIFTNLRDE